MEKHERKEKRCTKSNQKAQLLRIPKRLPKKKNIEEKKIKEII